MPDPNFSRKIGRTYTAVEWAVILKALKLAVVGLEQVPTPAAHIVRKLIPDLRDSVRAMANIEPAGCGLDNPANKRLLPR